MRLRSRYDWGLIVLYLPVPSSVQMRAAYLELLAWAEEVSGSLPVRCIPVVMMDGNGHLDSVQASTPRGLPAIGPVGRQHEN